MSSVALGGAIYTSTIYGSLVVNAVNFTGNYARRAGGAVSTSSTVVSPRGGIWRMSRLGFQVAVGEIARMGFQVAVGGIGRLAFQVAVGGMGRLG